MSKSELPTGLVAHLATFGVPGSENLWVRDWSRSLRHYRAERVFWIVDGPASVVVAQIGGEWRKLKTPPDYPALNAGIVAPDTADPSLIGEFQRELALLAHDPRVLLCDDVFAGYSDRVLSTYLVDGGGSAAELRGLCAPSGLLTAGGTEWRSTCRIMDFSGTVAELRLSGLMNPFNVREIALHPLTPAGHFNFADEF